eukprot:TRINITY_DN24237_c0_g1_i2.p1 TRINITY_DN24237_c0_g1~~TRINITY_DN24237_c0_g1_i2.p1  ORF type:complete len:137 (+),score=24.99 TRINITY_DN24237_c0_g1_i2:308-718(+)
MAGKPPASEYYFKGDAGLYDKDTNFPTAGGTPIENCANPFICDPVNGGHSNYNLTVPADAVYTQNAGACVAPEEPKKEDNVDVTGTTYTSTSATPAAETPVSSTSTAERPASSTAAVLSTGPSMALLFLSWAVLPM